MVEISPQASPPVCKIVDWGKYSYQKEKQLQKSRRKQKSGEVKQLRFGLKIGDHDMQVKIGKIRKFLEDGNKVKISAFYRGREMAHKDLGYQLLERIVKELDDVAIEEGKPQMSGRLLTTMVRGR